VDAVVTGAGGFIGGHLVAALLAEGKTVRALDGKPLGSWWQCHQGAENVRLRLEDLPDCVTAVAPGAEVYHLAADMGGMGFIEHQKAACALNVLPDANMLRAALNARVSRFFYASTACVYRADRQDRPGQDALREERDVYPAMPEAGYGEAKLFGERLCQYFAEDSGLQCRVARYHSVFGPHGTWEGGREKVPAAMCRKIAMAVLSGNREIEIWGDGEQQRSFLYIDDCVAGTLRLMRSGYGQPVNIGSSRIVTINELVTVLEAIAGVRLARRYVAGPRGVHSRSSDNTLARRELGWEPVTSLEDGMERTYRWVYDQLATAWSGRRVTARSAEHSGRP
jgi:nucleoside-diphosphate-sugar epimerase